jgi:hypothetical protein
MGAIKGWSQCPEKSNVHEINSLENPITSNLQGMHPVFFLGEDERFP